MSYQDFFNSPFFVAIIQGISIGMGTTFGAWLIQHNVIKRLESLETKVSKKLNGDKN